MLPDCEIVRGVVPAPDNFVLCKMHGHIIDLDTQQIVADNLKEFEARHPAYRKLPMPMLTDCAPEPGKVLGPANHVLCATHGHVLDTRARQVIAYSLKDYAKRFPAKPASPPAAAAKPAAPPIDRKHAREGLRDLLNGTSILIGDFQSQAADLTATLQKAESGPCAKAADDVQNALAATAPPIHAQIATAGAYIADFEIANAVDIPKPCQEARDAFNRVVLALNKLQDCVQHPPPRPAPGPAPDGVDEAAWKEQQEMLRRRDSFADARVSGAISRSLSPLRNLTEKIRDELDTAYLVARAILAG